MTDVFAGSDRAWIEQVLDALPTPKVLVERGSGGLVTFANRAAHQLAGGSFPVGPPEERSGRNGFYATYPDGRPIPAEEVPTARLERGELIENVEVEWHTPAGVRSLLVQGAPLPAPSGEPGLFVLSFEDLTAVKKAERAKSETTALLDSLFEGAPVGLAYFDRDLRYVRINDKLAEINGVPAHEHIGRTVPEVLPEMDARVTAEFTRVIDTGEPAVDLEFAGRTPASPDEERVFSASLYPVHGENGAVAGLGLVVMEITRRRKAEREREVAHELEREARAAAEEAATRARFLAEASVILDESLDYEATLATISRLAVPWLADWCVVDMAEPDGSLRRVTVAHVDPEKVELAEEWGRRYPTDPESPSGGPNVIRTGKSELYPEITDEMIVQTARDQGHLDMIRSLGMRAAMVVPMIARGRALGVISFIAAETGRSYDDDDLMLAEELARRAAMSVDNARLYEERSYIARTLQQSLLPPTLPDIPGIEVAGRYRPVGEGNEVGGDFYDLFEMGDASWAVVIGDVCGKGADAAALTALVRYTLRAIATADKLPSEVLRLLNDAILRQRSDNRFSTVVYARVAKTDDGARVELTSGGHPLPLVVRAGGHAESIGEPGTLLGVVHDPTLHDIAVDLGPGDSLVLYTDGVTEAGAPDHLMEPEDLAAILTACPAQDATALAECVEAAAVDASGSEPHDDIAIVVLHVEPVESELDAAPNSGASAAAG